MQEEKTVVDVHVADGSTSFQISISGKIIIRTEFLVFMDGPHTSGDKHSLTDHIVPQPSGCFYIG